MQKTTFAYEILIHDDASTDGTCDIIQQYEKKYPDIVKPLYEVKNQYQQGLRGSRTFNFPRATGKYIAMCEGDDYWTDPYKLQKQVDFLEENPSYSGVFHETEVTGDRKNNRVYGRNAPNICTVIDTFSTQALFHTSSLVFRKCAYKNPDWHLKVVSGDMALFSIVSKFGPLRKIPEIMSVYRKHDRGITSSPEVVNNFHQKRIELIQYLDAYHNYEYTHRAKEIINEHRSKLGLNENLFMRLKRSLKLRRRLKNFFWNLTGSQTARE